MAVGGIGVAVGGTGVAAGGIVVAVGGIGVAVGGTRVLVAFGGIEVAVAGIGVAVGGSGVGVAGTLVAVGSAVGGTVVGVRVANSSGVGSSSSPEEHALSHIVPTKNTNANPTRIQTTRETPVARSRNSVNNEFNSHQSPSATFDNHHRRQSSTAINQQQPESRQPLPSKSTHNNAFPRQPDSSQCWLQHVPSPLF